MKTYWTDELIEERILEVVDFHGYNRMPTMKEIEDYYGNTALTKKSAQQAALKLGLTNWDYPENHVNQCWLLSMKSTRKKPLKKKAFAVS